MNAVMRVRLIARLRCPGLVRGVVFAVLFIAGHAHGRIYTYSADSDLVGELGLASSVRRDTIADLARVYDQGYYEMRLANPTVDAWLMGEDTEVMIPSRYILPATPRRGIVINVPEMRLYFYSKGKVNGRSAVATHPVSIGRQDWVTPHGLTKVVAKTKDPSWYPPESIRAEHAAERDPLPHIVPPGPDNPLGAFAIRLGIPGYLIHGTDKPYGIGMRVTHGCIRMYPRDIESVFNAAAVGTPVRIVNQPYKVGVAHGQLFVEVHPPLDEDALRFGNPHWHVVELIIERTSGFDVELDWERLGAALTRRDGIPVSIGTINLPRQVAGRPSRSR